MKFNAYSKTHKGASIGFLPLFTTLVLLSIHYITGVLDWPAEGDIKAQRDFNSAIGMSAITGYFWFALRVMHQNVASTLISLLVKTNQLCQFSAHRSRLASEFKHHIFNSAIISIMITVLYCVVEGLITVTQEIHVFFLTVTAVPFWFLVVLFLFQISSNIKYLTVKLLPNAQSDGDKLKSIMTILELGTANAIFATGALTIFPVFWLKKDIPIIDVVALITFTSIIAFYLFLPVFRLRRLLDGEKKKVIKYIEQDISEGIKQCAREESTSTGSILEHMESEKERVIALTRFTFAPKDMARIKACIILIPISWFLLFFIEWLIQIPNYY